MSSSTNSFSEDYFLDFLLKQTNILNINRVLTYTKAYNPDILFVILGPRTILEKFAKCHVHPELVSISGSVTFTTRFILGDRELFLRLCNERRNIHLVQFHNNAEYLIWLEANVGADVGVLRRNMLHQLYKPQDFQHKYDRPVTIIFAGNGMGKTTYLNHIKNDLIAQKNFCLYLNDIHLRKFCKNVASINLISFIEFFSIDVGHPGIHIMYDNFDRLKDAFRDSIINILIDFHLNYRQVKQWITCSEIECRNKLESTLGTFACILSPVSNISQLSYLKYNWGIKSDRFDESIKSILDQCNKWNWKDNFEVSNSFSSYPLHLKMIASVFRSSYESGSQDINILDVYEDFVKLLYCNKCIEELAVQRLFEYNNYDFKFKTTMIHTQEKFEFLNVINYLAAKWFAKNFRNYKVEYKILLEKGYCNWSIQYFFNSFQCRGKELHTAVLNQWRIYDLCSVATINDTDAGGRTALFLTDDIYAMRTLIESGAQIDVQDDVLQWTPLQYCDCNGYLRCLNLLLSHGADIGQLTWTLSLSELEIHKRLEFATTTIPKCPNYAKFICENVEHIYISPKIIEEVFFDLPEDVYMKILNHAKKSNNYHIDHAGRTALFHAVGYNNFEAVKLLIHKLGFYIHHRCFENKTVFQVACENGFLEIAEYFLELGVNINVSHGYDNSNAFTDCCKTNKIDVLKFLLERGVNTNVILSSGETPLELGCAHGSDDVVIYLLKNATNLNINYYIDDDELLYNAVKSSSTKLVELLLKRNRITNINRKMFKGETFLHLACRYNNEYEGTILTKLIEAGADVNAADDNGCTPIFEMFYSETFNIVKILATNGCNLSHVNNNGDTSLHVFTRDSTLRACGGSQALYSELTYLIHLLVTYGADINARTPSGDTPTHFACKDSNLAVIQTLISEGADINAVNNNGETPLHLACIKQCTQGYADFSTIKYLVCKGADVNKRTISGKTPLMYAVDCPSNIDELINLGADK